MIVFHFYNIADYHPKTFQMLLKLDFVMITRVTLLLVGQMLNLK